MRMDGFLSFRDQFTDFYRRNDLLIKSIARAAVAFLVYCTVNRQFPSDSTLQNPLVPLILALLSAFLPTTGISIISGFLVLGNLYAISRELTIIALIVFLIVLLVDLLMPVKSGLLLALTPVLFIYHMPLIIPVIVGLSFGLLSAVPVGLGTFLYFFCNFLKSNISAAEEIANADITEKLEKYSDIFLSMAGSRTMILCVLMMTSAALLVYIFKTLPFNGSWYAGAGAGLACVLIFSLLAGDQSVLSLPEVLVQTALDLLIAVVYILFVHGEDFSGTERVSFEDDDYFYYVKAVPKLKPQEETPGDDR